MPIDGRVIKSFQFLLEIDGVPALTIQKVQLPEIEVEEVSHSVGAYDVKTAGRISVGDLVCEKLMVYDPLNDWAWRWLRQAQDFGIGGLLPDSYRKEGRLVLLQPDLQTILQTYELGKTWVKKVATADLDESSSENIIETVTFS